MARVIHFELNSDDPDKTINFYETIFGWKFKKWEGSMEYWMITTGDEKEIGIDGGMQKRGEPGASTNTVIGIDSIDDTVRKIEELGGTIVAPKMAVPGIGWAAYFKDVDGNLFGLMQEDKDAK